MKTYEIPLGMTRVSFRTRGPVEEVPSCRPLFSDYVFLKPNESYEVAVDGYPIIVAAVYRMVILAHARNAGTMCDVVSTLVARTGTLASRIIMCLQFASQDHEAQFIDCACRSGLRHVWTMHHLEEHPNLVRDRVQNHVVVGRNA